MTISVNLRDVDHGRFNDNENVLSPKYVLTLITKQLQRNILVSNIYCTVKYYKN